MPIYTSKERSWVLLLTITLITISLSSYGQTITGTVFRDFNSDGTYTSIPASGTYTYGEPGVGGVTVTAYNAAGTAVASTTTTSSTLVTAAGDYTLTVGNTNAYRIEFTNLSTGDYDGFRGTNSATSVQFVNGGTSNVNFGVNYPTDYCQADPLVVVPCYVNGDATGTGSGSTVSANRDVLVTLPYSSAGNSPAENGIALNSQLGAVYGVAYQREAKYIFTSAFLKRHSGLGPNGPGAIYLSKPSGSSYTHSVFITLPTAATAVTAAGSTTVASNTGRNLPSTAATANHDETVFDQVGKAGLGDLEISDDGTELFVVNLGDRKLYKIPINNPTSASPTAGTPVSYAIPTPSQSSGSQFRPFGLKYYRNKVYVGGVTTNEAVSTTISFGTGSTGNTALVTRDTTGMKAVVYEFDPATGNFAATPVLSFPLTYKKGASDNDQTGSSRSEHWFPWVDTQAPNSFLSRYARNDLPNASHPQPWLTDIEIDVDGSMIIGLRDRFGEQYGNRNYGTNTSDNSTLYRAIAPGDILRAGKCDPSVNQWTIERNARVCNGPATAGAGNGQGIGGGEYYFSDAIQPGNSNGPYHAEMTLGGLALFPGRDEVMSTAMDPTTNTDAGGLRKFKMDGSGDPSTSTEIFHSSDVSTYGKGNGLGDIELACDLAPIEIGNRVWLDSDNDGVQDPGENPVAGVNVLLKGPGLPAGGVSVTTNSNGEYYFSNGSGTAATGFVYSLTGLTAGGSYTLTFPTSVTTGNSYLSSKPNSATGANADNIDTDPNAAGLVTFTLGRTGQNNFSYDAGYVPCTPPSLTVVASSLSICIGTPVSLTAQVSPAGSYTYAWSAPAGVTLSGTTAATVTATGLATGTNTFTVTVSTSPICSTTATVAVVVNATPVASLSASQTTICAGQSVTLTASGGSTYRFSTTGTTSSTATAVVSPTVTTTYSVTVTNASGCSSTATTTVTVNPLPVASLTATTGLSTATICAGQSISLTASGGISYTFSTGLTNTTGLLVVSPTTTTTYSVTVANASGCRSTTTATVTVNALPTVTASSATVCAGQSATLTASGASTYLWSTGATTASISVSVAGPYSVTGISAQGCSATATTALTVNPLPVAILNSATICAGSSVTLTATGGTSYSFSTGLTNTTGLLTVSPTTTTTYSVTVTNANGCSSTATATVLINANPAATLSSATICVGQSVTLTATGGASYSFSTGTTNTTGLLVVNPTTTTTYSVTASSGANCSASATATVTVNTKPNAGADQVLTCGPLGATPTSTSLAASVAGGSWSNAPGNPTTATFSPSSATTTVSNLTTGTYNFIYTASNGCADTVNVTVPACQTFCATISVAASASSSTLTPGQSVTLTANVSPVSSYTYAWSGPGTITPSNTLSAVVSGLASGVHTFTVTVTSSPGCLTTAMVSVTVLTPTLAVSVTAGACQSTNSYVLTGTISLSAAVASTLTISDGSSSTIVSVNSGQNSVSFSLSGLTSGSGSHTVTVSGTGYTSVSTTYSAPASCTAATVSQCTPFDDCSGPGCPGNYPGTITPTQAPASGYIGTDDNFNVLVGGNFTVPSNGGAETEGRILVGGNFTMNSSYYGVGTSGGGSLVIGPNGEANLIVRGSIQRTTGSTGTLGNSQPGPPAVIGQILVGGTVANNITATGGAGTIEANQGAAAIDALVNINSVLANLTAKSSCYSLLTPTGTFNAGTKTLQGDNTSPVQVFNLTNSNLSTLASQNLLFANIPAGATIIVNVTGSVINWQVANVAASIANDPGYSSLGTTDPDVDVRRVLFNFGDATSVTFNSAVNGSVLVPNGDVVLNGNLNGRLAVGGNLTHSGASSEIHNYPFAGNCACASCSLAVTVTPGTCSTATNQYTVTGTVSFTNNPAQSLTITDGIATSVVSVSAGQSSVAFSLTGLSSGIGSHTVTVTSSATSCHTASMTYTAPASCTLGVALSVTAGLCQSATNSYAVTGTLSLTNAIAGTATITDGTATTAVSVSAGVTSVAFSLSGLSSGTNSHTVTVSYAGQTISTTYTAPGSCTNVVLSVEKFVDLSQATLGQPLTYTLVLTNSGTGAASNVVVRDSVSTGLRYVSGSATAPAGTTFTPGTPISTWTVGSISAGQSLSLTLQAIPDSSGVLYNRATILGDTAINSNDTATVCTSIPVRVCAGDVYTFRLTAPTGRSSYRWFRTYQGVSTELTSFTTNILDVTQPGSYSLAINNISGQCPDFSCCPFIVEEDTLPTFQAVAITGTCVGNTPQPNGRIVISGFRAAYTYQYSLGSSFNTGASLSGAAQVIPAGGVIAATLASPAVAQDYTVRVYNAAGCYTDVTVRLQPTVCACPAQVCVPYVVQQTKRSRRIGDAR